MGIWALTLETCTWNRNFWGYTFKPISNPASIPYTNKVNNILSPFKKVLTSLLTCKIVSQNLIHSYQYTTLMLHCLCPQFSTVDPLGTTGNFLWPSDQAITSSAKLLSRYSRGPENQLIIYTWIWFLAGLTITRIQNELIPLILLPFFFMCERLCSHNHHKVVY